MPRRRLETLLEQNLIFKGYKLTSKTYEGVKSEKVDSFIYEKTNGVVNYKVALNGKRNEIKHYSFTNKQQLDFTSGILDSLELINSGFIQELKEIYDFENKCAKEISYEVPDFSFDEPFIEESHFDDKGDFND